MHFATIHQIVHPTLQENTPPPYHWEKFKDSFPLGTVFASENYAIIRADYEGDVIIGKYSLQQRKAYISHYGKEIPITKNMQVLVASPGTRIIWVPVSHGIIPQGAVGPVGKDGLYVGRAICPKPESAITPGKVHPSHKCLYIPWNGKEEKYDNYEVCVITSEQASLPGHQQKQQQFVQYPPQQFQQQPQQPFPSYYNQGLTGQIPTTASYPSFSTGPAYRWETLYGSLPYGTVYASDDYAVIRADYEGDVVIGKYSVRQQTAYISHGSKEIAVSHGIEVLVAAQGASVEWIPASRGVVPYGAVGPVGKDGLYVGRAICPPPENKHTPGKIHSSHKCLYMPWDGKEERYYDYEACVIKF